ncbi:MAG: flagellar brake protein [Burkholderiales bacterium]
MQLHVGDRLQLEILADNTLARHFTALIGYLRDVSVIVRTPVAQGMPVPIREGEAVLMRAFSGRNAFAFEATVNRVALSPFAHIHLAYPSKVQSTAIRGALRVRANLAGTALNPAKDTRGVPHACTITDLSVTGAQLECPSMLADRGEKLRLFVKFTLEPNGYEVKFTHEVEVQSVRRMRNEASGTEYHSHGVRFEQLHATEALLVQSYIQQILLSDRSRIV